MVNRNTRCRLSEEVAKGVQYLSTGLVLIALIAGGLFMMNVSTSGQNGYKFRQQQVTYGQLEAENHQLQLQVLESGSFSEIQTSVQMEMVPADDVDYFESRDERLSALEIIED